MPNVTDKFLGPTAKRPYPCPQECGKFFTTRSDAVRHTKTHLSKGEREFQCRDCNFTAHQKYSLDRHIASVHLGIKLRCSYGCAKDYTDPSALSRHHQTHKKKTCRRRQPKIRQPMGVSLESEHPDATSPPPPVPIQQPSIHPKTADYDCLSVPSIYEPTPVARPLFSTATSTDDPTTEAWQPLASSTDDYHLWQALDKLFPLDQVIQLDCGAIPTSNLPLDIGYGHRSNRSPSSVEVDLTPAVDWESAGQISLMSTVSSLQNGWQWQGPHSSNQYL